MLDAALVMEALENKREQFLVFQRTSQEAVVMLGLALETLAAIQPADLAASLVGIPRTGAQPTKELGQFAHIVIPFESDWNNQIVQNTPTLAVGSSEIMPSMELLVGLVQIGIANRYAPDGQYKKEVAVEVLAAADTYTPEGRRIGALEEIINWRRFALEIDRIIDYMEANATADLKPVCFYNGSFVISFAEQLLPEHQALYVHAVKRLLAASAETQVPLVGFVHTSYANDLTTLAAHATGLSLDIHVSDAGLLRSRMDLGDRTQVFICDRDDAVQNKYYNDVCFAYLKTTGHNPPARVEFPRWVLEANEHERLIDQVRAECLVGIGYPNVMGAADAVAALTSTDRERFHALFHQFAERVNLPLFSRKAVSNR